jgi:hypothetical protein
MIIIKNDEILGVSAGKGEKYMRRGWNFWQLRPYAYDWFG